MKNPAAVVITPEPNPPKATPITTGTTSTRAVVATLMWLRSENITAPRATAKVIPASDPSSDRRLMPVTITVGRVRNDGGVMHEDRVRAGSFGEDAEQYDRSRPTYPNDLVEYIVGSGLQTVLDVGCGTGKAGRLFAEHGCAVLGIEPDG